MNASKRRSNGGAATKSRTGRVKKGKPDGKTGRGPREKVGLARGGKKELSRRGAVADAGGGRGRAKAGKKGNTQDTARGGVAKLFPQLKKKDGCGAMLVVAERAGAESDVASRVFEIGLSLKKTGRGVEAQVAGGGAKGSKRVSARGSLRVFPRTCRVLAAVGHEQRVRLLAKLLEGPATYRALQRVTKLKAGPLYHHINQLRLAGLILPKQRDLYELTRGGRNLILATIVIGPLIRDSRRRPVPKR